MATWDDVYRRVRADDEGKRDFRRRLGGVVMFPGDGRLLLVGGDEPHLGLSMSEWASGQLFERLGIPTGYARRLPFDLLAQNVNYWLQSNPEQELLFRAKDDTLRGILSDRFSTYDNMPVVEAVHECLGDLRDEVRVRRFHLDDHGFHLKMTHPTLDFTVGDLPGGRQDRVLGGLYVTNSEIGQRAVKIALFVERLVCSNGLVVSSDKEVLFYQRHVGITPAMFAVGVTEAIGNAFKASEETVDRMVRARMKMVESPSDVINRIAKAARLSQKVTSEVIMAYGYERELVGDNEFAVGQAFSRAARDVENENIKVDIEHLVGRILVEGAERVAVVA